jgi:hypothetical protein
MHKIISITEHLPKWYGLLIVLVYSILLAEFFSTINHLLPYDASLGKIFQIITRVNYVFTILSGIIIWLVMALLYHLTALLFDGQSSFGRFLLTTSYPYIIPAIMIVAGIFLLDTVQPPQKAEDAINFLMTDRTFKLAMNLVNYSFIPYYLIVTVFVHYIYQIRYLYAICAVAIPVLSIWGVTELIKGI